MKLELLHVKKSYDGKTEALKDVSFVSEKAEFISVIGRSGAGKTTLFRILNGTETTDSGSVVIDSCDVSGLKKREKRALQRRTGTVYQDFCLVEQASCLQNVLNACLPELGLLRASFGIFGKKRTDEALRLLERVGLGDKPDEPVRNLSGGQKQRVAIARALMQHPVLLLADEPIASLDPVTGRRILELMRELQKAEGLTVLMNSHNPELSAEFSDRVIGMRDGTVVFDGVPDELSAEAIAGIYSGGKATECERTGET